MDSSPDLSLKLRRGSSDSRESYYMDFAQGIDSDIEDVVTMASASGGCGTASGSATTTPNTLPAASLPDVTILSVGGTTGIIPEEDDSLVELDEDEGAGRETGQSQQEDREGVPTGTDGEPPQAGNDAIVLPGLFLSALDIDLERDLKATLQPLMPSPSVSQNAIVSPEAFSTHTSPDPSVQRLSTGEELHQQQQQQQLSSQSTINMPPAMVPITPDYPLLALATTAAVASTREFAETSCTGSSFGIQGTSKTMPPPQPGTSSASSSGASAAYHQQQQQQHHQRYLPKAGSPGSRTMGSTSVCLPPEHHHQHTEVFTAEDGMLPKSPSQTLSGAASQSTTTQHLSVLYHAHHHHLHPILTTNRRPSRLPEPVIYYPAPREIKPGEALATTLSALYGKLLVVMGIAFPMAEVISTYIPPSFYEGFYLYLYIGSMVFLFFMYTTLLWGKPKAPPVSPAKKPTATVTKKVLRRSSTTCSSDSGERSDSEDETISSGPKVPVHARRMSLSAGMASRLQHFGSFYLRMGAVAFGIGSMIYSGLEFGQYFELERDTKCHNVLLALTPATRMAFIFIQMYFIFLNNEQIKVYRHKIVARFGLMHMIGTNLSVWFSVLIQETKHEILTFYNPENRTLRISHRLGNKMMPHPVESVAHLRVARGLKGPHNIFECRRSNIIGTLVQDASPFLFPCTIEYSLICAAILYVMWRSISRPQTEPPQRQESLHPLKRSPHHYSVDCAGAHKGLFIGILILVLTIISLILFFVLISRPEFVSLAVTEVNICELTLYGTTTAATLIGMFQVRHMQYDAFRSFSLDDILLVGGQTGSFLYSTFTVIGGHFTMRRDTVLVLITALASLVETACQTMFILDASRRSAATQEHIRKKPGREIVTFLLVSNLAMWAINTLEKSRAESHPIQLHFYGLWAWTIITHVSMPLAIFYRFHSTVCLCEIWKRAYKMKPAYM
ncbi:proton channel OtopLc [Anopheles cruzii]|uniref:proton channel OtopLc n=1 Tax=Anopheles cruzii TaxID=68878 RepID=UPI0022EC3463|nr:proton channel OtopLc [Anopheles cruzii]